MKRHEENIFNQIRYAIDDVIEYYMQDGCADLEHIFDCIDEIVNDEYKRYYGING